MPKAPDRPAPRGADLPRARRDRRRVLNRTALVALGLVVATLASASVVIAAKLSGGGRQPESLVPASTFAFAKADLNPAAAQKIAVWQLVHRFPAARGRSNTDLFSQFVATGLPRCTDYAHDIRPWLGRRAGIAAVPSPQGTGGPLLVAVLQVRHDSLASAGLSRVVACSGGKVGFVLSHGYAVLTRDTASAAAVVAAAEQGGSLGADPAFRADELALGGSQVAMGWVDGGRVASVSRTVLAAGPHALIGGGVLASLEREGLRALANVPRGRLVLGLHATDDAFEITGRSIGAGLGPVRGDAGHGLRALPAGSLAGFAVSGIGGRRSEVALAARIRALLGPAEPLLGALLGARLEVTSKSGALVAGLVPTAGGSGAVGADHLLDQAIGSDSDSNSEPAGVPIAAGFVRLGPLLALLGLGNGPALSRFTAAGVVVDRDGPELGFRLRLVVQP